LLDQAECDARALEREGQAWGIAHAHYVRAAIAACRDDAGPAIEELTRATDLYERADMRLCAQLMRFRLGEIETSEEARALREEAARWLQEQGIASPVRWAAMSAPGFARISHEPTETTY
jgi:hypothetical protein